MKRRRKRGMSLDAEIRKSAKQIYETNMAEAYKAAALGIVARKLDEIRALLNAAGFQAAGGVPSYAAVSPQPVQRPAQPAGPTCVQCGQPAVRRGRANQWNRGNPPWYCVIHQALAGQIEAEDARDNTFPGLQTTTMTVKKPPVVIQTHAPPKIEPQAETPPPVLVPDDNSAGDGLAEAFKALGVAEQ